MALSSHPVQIDTTDTLTKRQEIKRNLNQKCDSIKIKAQQTAVYLKEIMKAFGIKPDTLKIE